MTLASFEPETQKTTTALLGLKMVSDPLMFSNLNSTAAAVSELRSMSSLPTGMHFGFYGMIFKIKMMKAILSIIIFSIIMMRISMLMMMLMRMIMRSAMDMNDDNN